LWGVLQVSNPRTDEVILNGAVQSAGYVCEYIDKALHGKTIELDIAKGASTFSDHRLMKITVNQNDALVTPSNVPTLLFGEYIPDTISKVDFALPDDFDGKLGFVFYQANLNDLQITASYR
jgi:hypothetical protein